MLRPKALVPTTSPYWYDGTAGVASAVLHFATATGDNSALELARQMGLYCCTPIALWPGLSQGMAGVGNFLLDCATQWPADPRWTNCAGRLIESIHAYRIEESSGWVMPGDSLDAVSCDLLAGSAGVALFVNRWATRGLNFQPEFDYSLRSATAG